MKPMRPIYALPLVACVAVLAVAGCKKKEPEAALPPAASTMAVPPPAPMTMAPPSAMTSAMTPVGVTNIELGSAVGADMKITMPKSTFAPKDKIMVAVTTKTTDPAATVPAKVGAKWTHVDSNQTVHEDARDLQLTGEQVHDFEITNPAPWPTGHYKVDVTVDGYTVQSRDFEVK